MKSKAYISGYNHVTKIYFTWLKSWGFKLSNEVHNVLVASVVLEIYRLQIKSSFPALMRAQTAKFSTVHTEDRWVCPWPWIGQRFERPILLWVSRPRRRFHKGHLRAFVKWAERRPAFFRIRFWPLQWRLGLSKWPECILSGFPWAFWGLKMKDCQRNSQFVYIFLTPLHFAEFLFFRGFFFNAFNLPIEFSCLRSHCFWIISWNSMFFFIIPSNDRKTHAFVCWSFCFDFTAQHSKLRHATSKAGAR